MRPAECRGLTWDQVDLEAGLIDVSWQLQALPYKVARNRASGFKVPIGFAAKHLEGRWILVRPKTASGQRMIPMAPWLIDSLLQWRDIAPVSPHGLVWSDDGHPMDGKLDRAMWVDICAAAGISPCDLYSARHTTATILREAGVADEIIIQIVGHSSIHSTRPYIHVR